MDNGTVIVILAMGGSSAFVVLVLSILGWLGWKDVRRGEEHLAQLAHLNAIDSRQFWKEHERYRAEADKRSADHETLMRMIFERVDGKPRPD